MRILAIMLTLLLLVVGSYTYYWFKKADDFKAAAEQIIAAENAKAKPYTKDGLLIRYDQIVMSGYPFLMQINIIKPVMDIPASSLLQSFANKDVAQTEAAAKANLVLEINYSDKISLASNLWANEFTFTLSGDSIIKPLANNEAKRTVTTILSAPAVCHLAIENTDSTPWTLSPLIGDAGAFLEAFRYADCDLPGLTSKYTDTGELLSSSDDFSLSGGSRPVDPQNYRITFTLDAKNVKALPAYDALLNSYMTFFYDALGTSQDQRQSDISLSQYGNQNTKIDLSYEGPLDKKYILDPDANVNFDIVAFDFKNVLYSISNKLHFSTAVHSDRRESILRVNSSFTSTESYEQLLVKQLTKAFTDMAKTPTPEVKFTTELAALNKPDVLAAAFIPKLHNLGEINFNADVNASNDKAKGILYNSDLLITALDLTADKYGAKIKGTGKSAADSLPGGELFVTCMTCDNMIDGIGAYATAIDSLLASVRAGQVHYVTQPLIDGTKQFLHAISEPTADKNSKDILVHLVADDKGNVTVSGKQLLDVMGLYNADIGQYIVNMQQPPEPQILKPEALKKNKKKTAP